MKKNNLEKAINLGESLETLSESYDLYILFIDLCGSTEIKQFCLENEIPDITWISRLQIFLARTATIIQQYEGQIIKTIGDEVMATFSIQTNPSDIIKCVMEIFQTFDNLKSYKTGKFKIFSKAAIDFGSCFNGQLLDIDVIDPIGTCVDRCARLGKYVNKGEIIFSCNFHELLTESNFKFSNFNLTPSKDLMKGLGEIEYYKISFNTKA
jgi:class 3 adenylate cyclase